MTIYFRVSCKAIQTEYRHIEAPPGWEEMIETDRIAWLAKNIDSSHFDSADHHRAEDRTVLDYRGS